MLRPPSPHLVARLGLLALVACGEGDSPTQPTTGVYDFALVDVNPTSP